MKKSQRQRYWFWVESDDPLAKTLDELGTRERNAWLVAIVRAGLSSGGYRDVIQAIERLTQGSRTEMPLIDSAPMLPPADVSEFIDDAMSQLFGSDEE